MDNAWNERLRRMNGIIFRIINFQVSLTCPNSTCSFSYSAHQELPVPSQLPLDAVRPLVCFWPVRRTLGPLSLCLTYVLLQRSRQYAHVLG